MGLEQKFNMVWRESLRRLRMFGVPLPKGMQETLRTLGVVSILQIMFRYTFMGEFLARMFHEAVGEDPIEEVSEREQAPSKY